MNCFEIIIRTPNSSAKNIPLHIEKIYYYEVTFRHSGKSTQNGVPGLHLISHKWFLKKFLKLTNPDLQKSWLNVA